MKALFLILKNQCQISHLKFFSASKFLLKFVTIFVILTRSLGRYIQITFIFRRCFTISCLYLHEGCQQKLTFELIRTDVGYLPQLARRYKNVNYGVQRYQKKKCKYEPKTLTKRKGTFKQKTMEVRRSLNDYVN